MIQIYVGPTGCGKTYQAFNRLNKKMRAIYLAPCRQLVYESAMKYGNSNCHVRTSDLNIGDKNNCHISFRTYQACRLEDLKICDVLIIDEAHFMSNTERGPHLVNLVHYMDKRNKKVILLSATLNFTVKGAKIIRLAPRGGEFKKKEISYEAALARAAEGVPTLIFHKTRMACGSISQMLGMEHKCGIITADTSIEDRIRLVDLYNRGKITIIEATNSMAQGVNVPCENLLNFSNSYDGSDVIIQKFGRLGRTGVTRENAELTYWFQPEEYWGKPIDINKEISKIKSERVNNIISIRKEENTKVMDYDLRTPSSKDDKRRTKHRIEKAWHSI